MTAAIRVVVAGDAALAQRVRHLPGMQLVGEAADPAAAVGAVERHRPAVLAIAAHEATPAAIAHLMAVHPLPILVLVRPGQDVLADACVDAGAVDRGAFRTDGEDDRKLASALRVVSRVPVVRRKARGTAELPPPPPAGTPVRGPVGLVALGASTGGPAALATVLAGLGPDFALPVLIVLHLDASFAERFVSWLRTQIPLPVALAKDGDSLQPGVGRVLVAPPDHHMEVRANRVRLTQGPERHACRPAVDPLFESLAAPGAPRVVAALLTGMGRDGASGLAALREAGAATIAQDEETSVVFGMPREAIRLGAAGAVLPLPAIGPAVGRLVREGGLP